MIANFGTVCKSRDNSLAMSMENNADSDVDAHIRLVISKFKCNSTNRTVKPDVLEMEHLYLTRQLAAGVCFNYRDG